MALRNELDQEQFEGLLLMEPRERYDKCVIGVARHGSDTFFVYDEECVLRIIGEDIDNFDEAREYYEFNTVSAWFGPNTPAFLDNLSDLSENIEKYPNLKQILNVFPLKSGVQPIKNDGNSD